MEQISQFLEKANSCLKTADHLTYITYPLINDVKLSVTIMENLYLSLIYSMNALLRYDYLFKRISIIPDNFEQKFHIFKTHVAPRYNIPREHIVLIEDIKKIMDLHKKSPIEFRRKDKFIICTDNYRTQAITINRIKEYLSKTKPFVQKVNLILMKNDSLFRR